MEPQKPQIQPGYPALQLARALMAANEHADIESRERAQARAARWTQVIAGMLGQTLSPGARAPIEGVPVWATPEIVTGGFATGTLLASGPLLPHELNLLSELGAQPDAQARARLNAWYLSEAGLARLHDLLDSGHYALDVPEEGALLVVATLLREGPDLNDLNVQVERAEAARELIEILAPWFSQLRFYPRPTGKARRFGPLVSRQSAGAVRAQLAARRPLARLQAQKEAVNVWAPLYDEALGLLVETVVDDWPCQYYPAGWPERVSDLLARYDELRERHRLCGRPDRDKDSFAALRAGLRLCLKDPASLSGRDVGRLRLLLHRSSSRHGLPGSERRLKWRAEQRRQVAAPGHELIAKALARRLEAVPPEEGLDDLEAVLAPIAPSEAHFDEPVAIPPGLVRKLERCLRATVDVLVARGILPSAEALAGVLPQLVASLRAAGHGDPVLRQLDASLYEAFSRRRSLLLLDLQAQIRAHELPWMAALMALRPADTAAEKVAEQALVTLAALTLEAFPQALVPNVMLRELTTLAKTAGHALPLVKELAVDIFMGQFSPSFVAAARQAAELLDGKLYSSYYEIDWQALRALDALNTDLSRCQAFAKLCEARAGLRYQSWFMSGNGMIIEQQQILTTQNLAVLYAGLALEPLLADKLPDMARRNFVWICRRQQERLPGHHAERIVRKQTAYAWRQLVFYLSLLPETELQAFLVWADQQLQQQDAAWRDGFWPVMQGLRRAIAGQSPDAPAEGARRLLGWTLKG
ncbi:MAG: hypothetical protein CVV27_06880 [Candidatus Melainabacteria bacterium HGW-Melainabacteria-1]|nr:MAG: hypothetical protein CVV27_06880 [Candidatus Melainabacteria bacterium HGW-Melainabacteria-1]